MELDGLKQTAVLHINTLLVTLLMHRLRSSARRLSCNFEKHSDAHCDKKNPKSLHKITLLILNYVRYPLDIVCKKKKRLCMNCISLLNTNSFQFFHYLTQRTSVQMESDGDVDGIEVGSRWTPNQKTTYLSVNKRTAAVYKALPAVPGDPRGHTEPLHIRTNVCLFCGNIINKILPNFKVVPMVSFQHLVHDHQKI